jgi:hypothetical protein
MSSPTITTNAAAPFATLRAEIRRLHREGALDEDDATIHLLTLDWAAREGRVPLLVVDRAV